MRFPRAVIKNFTYVIFQTYINIARKICQIEIVFTEFKFRHCCWIKTSIAMARTSWPLLWVVQNSIKSRQTWYSFFSVLFATSRLVFHNLIFSNFLHIFYFLFIFMMLLVIYSLYLYHSTSSAFAYFSFLSFLSKNPDRFTKINPSTFGLPSI